MSILERSKVGNDIYKYLSSQDQQEILIALKGHDCDFDIDSEQGIIIADYQDDHCGESWIDIQIIDSKKLTF